MQYDRLILDINNPNVAFDSSGGTELSLRAFECEIDGVRYSIDSIPDAIMCFVTIQNRITQSDVILNMNYAVIGADNVLSVTSIITNLNIVGKSVKVKGISSSTTLARIPDSWAQYITVIGNSFNAVINGSNITTISNPPVNDEVVTYEESSIRYYVTYAIHSTNPIRIRANDGYVIDINNITITSNNRVMNSNIINRRLEDNGKELVIDSIKSFKFSPNTNPVLDTTFVLPPLSIQVVPVSAPNEDIENNLNNVTNSNSATSVLSGARYQATLTPTSGYYISSVLITMNGVDITDSVYDNGTIDIPSVTGTVIINAYATVNPTVTNNLLHCTTNNPSTSHQYGTRYQATITADNGYSLEGASVLITMGGIEQFNVYNNGAIDIPSVTGDIYIYIEANTVKTFNFKSMDGATTYATVQVVKITTIRLNLNSNTRTLIVNGNVVGTWIDPIPVNHDLYGLALTVNASKWFIPVNMEVYVNFDVSTNFYEVILEEKAQAETFSTILYKNSADAHKVDKTPNLELVATVEGVLREPCSIMSPQLKLERGIIDFNYVYIPIFERYYFVSDIGYLNKNLLYLVLKVDVLMSFKDDIYNQHALISRNEFQYDEDIVDNNRVEKNAPIIDVVGTIQQADFFNPDLQPDNIILNVIGGN